MLGFAFQKGAIPLSLEALLRAIEINGAAVEMNKQAFTWGRLAAHDMSRIRSVLQFRARATAPVKTLDEQIALRAEFLTGYQDKAYADRYLAAVDKVRKAESAAAPSSAELTEAVAKNLFKLMAYKDEYEVARLYTDGSFAKKLSDKFDGDFQLKFYLAPPIFAKRDKSGRLMKKEYGGWMLSAFGWLAKLKFLRGTGIRSVRPHRGAQDRAPTGRGLYRDDRPARLWAEARANPAAGEDRAHPRDHPRLRPCEGREHQEGRSREGTAGRRSRKQPVCGCGGVAFPFSPRGRRWREAPDEGFLSPA